MEFIDVPSKENLDSQLQELIDKYNPCQIKDGKCIVGEFPCCHGWGENVCEMLSEKGCQRENTECKLYFCSKARENAPDEFIEKITELDNQFRKELKIILNG